MKHSVTWELVRYLGIEIYNSDTLVSGHVSSSIKRKHFAGDYNWEEEHEKFSSFHKDIGESENHDHLSSDQYGLHEVCLSIDCWMLLWP